jgi:uncharacterized membrane protein (TIGR02234 family)
VAEPRRRRSSFGPTLAAGLAGAGLATVAATQPWAEATTRSPAVRTVTASGADVAPAVLPLALVALACWGTVLVLRRRGRRVVSVLGLVAAALAGAVAATAVGRAADAAVDLLGDAPDADASVTAWPWVAFAGSVVACLAFAVALASAGRWPEMSARYDAPGDGPPADSTDRELWKALDEGRDPTA